MEEITGYVDHIIFRNSSNAYTVLVLIPEEPVTDRGLEDETEVTCVGIFPSVNEGENIRLTGEFRNNDSYGMQFAMASYQTVAPSSEEAVKRYLGSGAIKGIGPSLAARIVKQFGKDTFRIIEQEPERLAEVKGISEKKASEVAEQLISQRDQRETMMELTRLGVTSNMAVKIYNEYGQVAMDRIKENPYCLAEDIEGIGFNTADKIAARMGFARDSDFRVQSGIIYTLTLSQTDGNTYLPKERLTAQAQELLGVERDKIEEALEALAYDRKIKVSGNNIYSSVMYRMEERTAEMITQLDEEFTVDEDMLASEISSIEKKENMKLDTRQIEAVTEAARHGVFILTGGPGTGKTTTIRTIIDYFENEGLTIRLAAPTGRAAKRMTEACGQDAQTIHRLLEVQGGRINDDAVTSKPGSFDRNEDNPLEADVIIIDEMSMVDITIMYSLLRAVQEGTRLILVGDVNQLPSVGPGNVLKDIIASGAFSVVKLENIFRQDEASDIVINAHRINRGEEVRLDNKSRDFFFLQRDESARVIKATLELVSDKLPRYVRAQAFDIQVLTPMRKGSLGVERLNSVLQKYLNPPSGEKKEHEFGDRIFRTGDKVMQTKNNYQMEWRVTGKYGITVDSGTGIFNGDLGIIKEVNDDASMFVIEFDDGHVVDYPYRQVDELDLAYALTIHKSQGSEYPAVVIPLLAGPKMLYNRNLIYTAVTRAKKCVVIVGDRDVFCNMVQNDQQTLRCSGLADRIRKRSQL